MLQLGGLYLDSLSDMWVLARVTGPHASEKYMAQFFLELNTVSSGPYFIIALENTEGTDCI